MTDAERCGYLKKKSGAFSAVHRRWFVLRGGTLLWFTNEAAAQADNSAQGWVHLRDSSTVSAEQPLAKKHGGYPFNVRAHKDYVLVAETVSERDAWVEALVRSASLPPLTGLDKTAQQARAAQQAVSGKKGGGNGKRALIRAKTSVLSRAVTSNVGKKLLREFCTPETFTLLDACRGLAAKDSALPASAGQAFENALLRGAVTVGLLLRHGVLLACDLDFTSRLASGICVGLVQKFDAVAASGSGGVDQGDPNHEDLCRRVSKFDAELATQLGPHMAAKHLAKLRRVIGHFGDPQALGRIMTAPALAADLWAIVSTLRVMYSLFDPNAANTAAHAPASLPRPASPHAVSQRRLSGKGVALLMQATSEQQPVLVLAEGNDASDDDEDQDQDDDDDGGDDDDDDDDDDDEGDEGYVQLQRRISSFSSTSLAAAAAARSAERRGSFRLSGDGDN